MECYLCEMTVPFRYEFAKTENRLFSTFEFNLVFNSCIQLKCELFVKKRKKLRLKYSYG